MWNIHNPFRFFTASVCCALVLVVLAREGLFTDGLTYSAISRNLAEGYGSLWFPHYSNDLYSSFHEHPPLAFWLQSLFFMVLGNGLYTEKVYCLICGIAVVWLIIRIWKELSGEAKESADFSWLPVLLWICVPVVSWGLDNNMLENTMAVFTSASVLFILIAARSARKRLLYLAFAAIMIFAGMLVKGPVALFPLAAIMIHWLVFRRFRLSAAVLYTIYTAMIVVLVFTALFIFSHDAWLSMNLYFQKQLVGALEGQPTVSYRLWIIPRMFRELGIILVIVLLVLLAGMITRKKAFLPDRINLRKAAFGLLTGLSASLPLMISMKQSGYYIIPSYPWFALGFAFIILPAIQRALRKLPQTGRSVKVMTVVSVLMLAGVLTYTITQAGTAGRDEEKIHDVKLIGSIVPQRSTIGISHQIFADWALHGYMQRYYGISLDAVNVRNHRYFLALRDKRAEKHQGFTEKTIPLKQYTLFVNDSIADENSTTQ